KLNAKERAENMSGAFKLRKNISLQGKTFLLIDDVITTGATIRECAIVLKNAGAEKIYAASAGISHLDPTSGREPISPELSDRFE
ncbi:MAG: ComF family protein, partial [Chlorobi bacterium]|nr:ComF family protein [Chlorobiota bacterium]